MHQTLIFMDIDGTLVDRQMTISAADRHAIHQVIQRGAIVYVATGRKFLAAKEIALQLHDQVQVIASNGCVCQIDQRKEVIGLDAAVQQHVYQAALAKQLPLFFFGLEKTFYTNQLPAYFSDEDRGRLVAGKESLLEQLETLPALAQRYKDIINGIVISEDQPAALQALAEELQTIKGLTVSSSHSNNLELIPAGISKATAIAQVQQHYQISVADTIAFGDGMNDVEMFQAAGVSVAMGNASEEVKAYAAYETLANTDSGISHFLNSYF